MAEFSLETARLLVNFSIEAYNDPPDINLEPYGYNLVEFINDENTDTQCFIARKERSAVLAFRGTSSIKDAITDITISKINFPDFGFLRRLFKLRSVFRSKSHSGFFNSFHSVKADIDRVIEQLKDDGVETFYVTGHSLGGALATIGALNLKTEFKIKPIMYTYGAPKVGNKQFVGFFNRQVKNAFRVVNDEDPVPSVPGVTFKHVKNEALIDEEQVIKINPGFFERFEKGLETIKSILTIQAVGNHSSNNYKELLDSIDIVKN